MSPLAAANVATAAILLILGLAVLSYENYSRASRAFFLTMLPSSVWLACFACMYSATDDRVALFWARSAYLGVALIPAAITRFTLALLGRETQGRRAARLSLLLSVVFTVGFLKSSQFIPELYHYSWGVYPRYAWGGVVFILYFVAFMIFNQWLLWTQWRGSTTTRQKTRIGALCMAFGVAYFGSIDYVAKFGVSVYPLGFVAVALFAALCARAIWKYRLVDITPAFAAEQILEMMPSAVIVTDIYGEVRVANRSIEEITGLTPNELIGRSLAARGIHFIPRGAEQVPAVPYRDFQAILPRHKGSIDVDVSASWLTDGSGLRVGVVYVLAAAMR
jgi:PAS domain S-box-containing protein